MSEEPAESAHEWVGADPGEVITACARQRELADHQRLVAGDMRERIRSQRADLDRYRRYLDEWRRSSTRTIGPSRRTGDRPAGPGAERCPDASEEEGDL